MVRRNHATPIVVFILALTISVFLPVRSFDFVDYDDSEYVFDNIHVRDGITLENIRWAFTTTHFSYWHPLTWLSHMTDVEFFGLQAGRHHLVNLVFHALNAVVLFLALSLLTGAPWRSGAVAVLFAVLPVNVESVAWVSERKNLLVALFWFLTLGAYAWYVRRPGVLRYSAVILCFAASLMSKPMAVTLPLVLLLLDFWPLGRATGVRYGQASGFTSSGPSRLVLEKVPLLLLSMLSSVITFASQQSGGSVKSLGLYSFPARLENAPVAYLKYLGSLFWPQDLAVIYPHPGTGLPLWKPIAAVTALLVITVGVIVLARRRGYTFAGWFWFLGTLVPVIGLVQSGGQALADRYAYLPVIGILILVVWSIADLSASWRHGTTALLLMFSGALIANVAVTTRQIKFWRDSEALFRRAVTVTDNNYVARLNLGSALFKKNAFEEAAIHFREAAQLRPNEGSAHMNLGLALERAGKREEAARAFRTAIRISSGNKP